MHHIPLNLNMRTTWQQYYTPTN